MKTWAVDIGFRIAVGGGEEPPTVDQVRGLVQQMLGKGKLGVAHFHVDDPIEENVYVKDLSKGEE